MKHIKSEKLKKLESELNDLEQWLKLDLVPKKDLNKHKEEIVSIKNKIEDEKERLQLLKESGEMEEYIAPKRPTHRSSYSDSPTIPDIDANESMGGGEADLETDVIGTENTTDDDNDEDQTETDDDKTTREDEDEESYFSERNRWRRGGIVDPDANEW